MLSTPVEFWVTVQIVIDLCLIILFVIFIRQVKMVGDKTEASDVGDITDVLEPVLKDAQKVAEDFEAQLKEKQRIVRKLNEHLDSRIISLNLLINRTEACLDSSDNTSGQKTTRYKNVYHLQQEIIALSEKGLAAEKIGNRLDITEGEVTLVLDLKNKFREMEQA